MGILYVDYKGNEKFQHSYSAGQEFDQCPYKFYLRRILGWSEKDTKAALLFGRALEDAIQYYHEHNGQGGVEEFTRLWANAKDKPLIYTTRERDWASLLRAGQEMMQLYAIRQPLLPMPLSTRFQRQFSKEMFPGDARLGGIELYGKLDAIPAVDPAHPMLEKLEWKPEYGAFRQVIVDIKTSGVDFDETPGIVINDLQLRTYSYLTNIRDVAFIWFKKNLHELEKGTSVTLLKHAGESMKPGDEAVVAAVEKEDEGESWVYLVKNDTELDEMKKFLGEVKATTKEGKALKQQWLENAATYAPASSVTRQRLQFNTGIVSFDSAQDAGRISGNQIARIADAWDRKIWPNTFGIRFPHDDRQDSYFRAFVLNDKTFRDATFQQKGEEPMEDFGEAAE